MLKLFLSYNCEASEEALSRLRDALNTASEDRGLNITVVDRTASSVAECHAVAVLHPYNRNNISSLCVESELEVAATENKIIFSLLLANPSPCELPKDCIDFRCNYAEGIQKLMDQMEWFSSSAFKQLRENVSIWAAELQERDSQVKDSNLEMVDKLALVAEALKQKNISLQDFANKLDIDVDFAEALIDGTLSAADLDEDFIDEIFEVLGLSAAGTTDQAYPTAAIRKPNVIRLVHPDAIIYKRKNEFSDDSNEILDDNVTRLIQIKTAFNRLMDKSTNCVYDTTMPQVRGMQDRLCPKSSDSSAWIWNTNNSVWEVINLNSHRESGIQPGNTVVWNYGQRELNLRFGHIRLICRDNRSNFRYATLASKTWVYDDANFIGYCEKRKLNLSEETLYDMYLADITTQFQDLTSLVDRIASELEKNLFAYRQLRLGVESQTSGFIGDIPVDIDNLRKLKTLNLNCTTNKKSSSAWYAILLILDDNWLSGIDDITPNSFFVPSRVVDDQKDIVIPDLDEVDQDESKTSITELQTSRKLLKLGNYLKV